MVETGFLPPTFIRRNGDLMISCTMAITVPGTKAAPVLPPAWHGAVRHENPGPVAT